MLIHLLFIGQIVFFVVLTVSHPSGGHQRRQADSPTHAELTWNVIPSGYELPGLQLFQNRKLLHPSQGNLMYFPPNSAALRDDGIPADLKEVQGISNSFIKEGKSLQRGQRKQPKPEAFEPCGHFQKNDYNMLSSIIGKMSSEARNALIDALLKTLVDKSKVSAAKSGENKILQQSLDAALQPPLRLNPKPESGFPSDGPLVQPFSLTVEREKLRDLYKYLNNDKFRKGLKKTNVMINLGELLQETIRKDECTTKKTHCSNKHSTTKSSEALPSQDCNTPERCSTEVNDATPTMQEDADSLEDCNCGDQYNDILSSSIAEFPADKVINLTQIFNVQPKLLIVNAGSLNPTDIAGLLNDKGKPECQTTTAGTTQCVPTQACTTIQVASVTARNPPHNHLRPPTRRSNNHRKCTRRHCGRQGCRHRYDRRGHACPIQDLAYTYYVDMDDLLPSGD